MVDSMSVKPPWMKFAPHVHVVQEQRNASIPVGFIAIIGQVIVRIRVIIQGICVFNCRVTPGLRISRRRRTQIGLDLRSVNPSVVRDLSPIV
jgi:hypothetical protein